MSLALSALMITKARSRMICCVEGGWEGWRMLLGVWVNVGETVGTELGWLVSTIRISGEVEVGPTSPGLMPHPARVIARSIKMKCDFTVMFFPLGFIVIDGLD
jgi:hypothetical protein